MSVKDAGIAIGGGQPLHELAAIYDMPLGDPRSDMRMCLLTSCTAAKAQHSAHLCAIPRELAPHPFLPPSALISDYLRARCRDGQIRTFHPVVVALSFTRIDS